ncbi:3-hydroxyacyl-[acyl-carrier-protein] dehydratase FabA [Parashewanella curva]|uniref:3-hydroxyacyl-[acyl-carrier-protein] dehydratase FabA n=1 Tax=Parashewanella curva TaxID=2338552 RepID=A0A3L8PVQ5_9GAMM|nr:beta-ketoacyl synthase N-terminal-like domain-containing protein [Parashewanella curva]RLV59404.1 3-hydroxyacyl-[acyl-carrier-protein] dehydratase FabA [Parashewanella curva]
MPSKSESSHSLSSRKSSGTSQKIAIVGLAARYPDANNAQEFWQNLLDKQDSRTQLTADKLNAQPVDYQGQQGESDRFYCDRGGYVQDFTFEADGYHLPAERLAHLDDGFLWALDCGRKALADANISLDSDALSRTGVVMGSLSFPTKTSNELVLPLYHQAVEKGLQQKFHQPNFKLEHFSNKPQFNADIKTHLAAAHSASQVLHQALGLGGCQLTLDAACASSVYAVKLACDYLNSGKADVMLAGAMSGADPFFINMGFSIFHAYPDNNCSAPFDENSQGLFAGEGAGVLVLKRLADAERDGDKIYGVISGVGLSNDGKGQFVLSPNSKGQVLAFERAYADAKLDPKQVEAIECHATGTPLGDKVELTSMEQFFTDKLDNTTAPMIGSAKSNLGHLLTAAGMPGIMKMIFAMEHEKLPATINLNQTIASPDELFSGKQVPTETQVWPKKSDSEQKHAGVSVFGFGGCNAHLVLESYQPNQTNQPIHEVKPSEFLPLHISGIASHFGRFDSINAWYQGVQAGESGFTQLPPLRWKGLQNQPELLAQWGMKQVPQGGFIESFDFDFLRFKVPPNEDDRLIAQQLLLIKVADEAIRDAKLKAGSNVAVLVAMETEPELHQFRGRVNLHTQIRDSLIKQGISLSQNEYQQLEAIAMDSVLDAAKLNQYTSFIGNIMASRISSLWDFNGPAFTISAAEHSVNRCLEVADNLMMQDSLDAVVIAAVDLSGSAEQVILHHQVQAVNPEPNQSNEGWNIGEGAGAIVLSSDAEQSYGQIQDLSFDGSLSNDSLVEHNSAIELPQSNQSAAQSVGHCFAASGMASLLHSLLKLNTENSKAVVQTQTLSQISQLLLAQNTTQQDQLVTRLSQDLTWTDSKHLIKTVTLGGRDIVEHICKTPMDNQILKKVANAQLTNSGLSIKEKASELIHIKNTEFASSSLESASMNDLQALTQNQSLAREAHLAYLKTRQQGLQIADALLKQQQATILGLPQCEQELKTETVQETIWLHPHSLSQITPYVAPIPERKPCIWDYHDLVEYAEGDIAKVFGNEYAVIDNYARRVRLPTTDYLLVSRVTKLNAATNEYQPSTMTTEYDIPVDAPYLVDGQIPWAVAVESGQCDLMLISYLGIDFENKGERVYRLLDCTLTFLGDLPRGGDTLRYDISINNFARNGETLLFFFSYECFVGDKMILKMDGGCAGFFTDQELADGKGVIRTDDEIATRNAALSSINKPRFEPLIHCPQTQFNYQQIANLLSGDIGNCFGGQHANYQAQHSVQQSLCFASEKFLMIEQVNQLDIHGGAWGLGFVEGEKQLAPDHWYFPCHFKDDQVMAGSLMAEGCGQLLQFFMLHLGMHTQVTQGRFQPLKDASQKVRCRGQVLPQHGTLTYRMEVTEIGLHPHPYAKANIDILLNGKVVVDFQNLGVMIKEEVDCTRYIESDTQSQIDFGNRPNAPLMAQIPDHSAPTNKGVVPIKHVPAPLCPDYPNTEPDTLPYTPHHLFEFATGDIEKCFGSDFSIYRDLIPPRTPCGDLQLTTRVIDIQGKRGDLRNPASCIAEYEVPEDAWYFEKNTHDSLMPYSVLMEISLQPNGFISAWMGTTLQFPNDELFFRNLDGSGELLRHVDLRGKTIMNESKLLSTVVAGSNIIQNFTFELSVDNEPFYRGSAVFGYFKEQALTHQLGLDNGSVTQAWHHQNQIKADVEINLLDDACPLFISPDDKPHYRLAGEQLNFIDKVDIVRQGGKAEKGYLYAERTVDASDWFFQFHFHQDPVMPGSLGVEAIIELMQTFALNEGLGKEFSNPKFGQILSDIKWKYRGQITPLNKQMSLDVHITDIIHEPNQVIIKGDANLSKDGLRIYEVTDIAICLYEG